MLLRRKALHQCVRSFMAFENPTANKFELAFAAGAAAAAAVPGEAWIEDLHAEIKQHKQRDSERGYISTVLSSVWRKDEKSLDQLQQMYDAALIAGQKDGDRGKLEQLKASAQSQIAADRKEVAFQDEIAQYGVGFLKTAAMFSRGPCGTAATMGVYALEAMNPNHSHGAQLLEGCFGAARGGLTKEMFHVLGSNNLSFASRGVALGMSSRAIDLALTPGNYFDKSGQFSLRQGLYTGITGTFDRKAIAADAIIFGAAQGASAGLNALTAGALQRNPFLSTVLTGTTFGFSSGSTSEIMRQEAAGEEFDLGKVLKRGLIQGALDSVAAIPGGMQAQAEQNRLLQQAFAMAQKNALEEVRMKMIDPGDPNTKRQVVLVGSEGWKFGHEAREFLYSHGIPYAWICPEQDPVTYAKLMGGQEGPPRIFFSDSQAMINPTELKVIADRVGIATAPKQKSYQAVVIGAGVGGLQTAIRLGSDGYGNDGTDGKGTLLIDREGPGGQIKDSARLENFLGFPGGIKGRDLALRGFAQAKEFGVEYVWGEVNGLNQGPEGFTIKLANGETVNAKSVVVASGMKFHPVDGIEGLDRLLNSGVYYSGGPTELEPIQDHRVMIVGAGNSAGQAALKFAESAKEVVILSRGDGVTTMADYLQKRIKNTPNITVRSQSIVSAVEGDLQLETVSVKNKTTGQIEKVPATSLFIYAGQTPATNWLHASGAVFDKDGFVVTGPEAKTTAWGSGTPRSHETSIPGLFAAGSVEEDRQNGVAASIGRGAEAANEIEAFLDKNRKSYSVDPGKDLVAPGPHFHMPPLPSLPPLPNIHL